MKIKRKKKLVDYSFQLKTAIPAVIISLLSFSIVIGFIVLITGISGTSAVTSSTRELDRAVADEDNIVTSFKEYAKRVKDPIFILATEKIEDDHRKSISVIKENIEILKAHSEKNNQLLALTVIVMLFNIILIFIYLIRATHKAAGPVQVMARQLRDILERRRPGTRSLRKNDEFKEFYDDFIKLIERIKLKSVEEQKPQETANVTEMLKYKK